MNDVLFYKQISESTAHRPSREFNSDFVLNNPEFFKNLVAIAFNANDKFHYKACWILELVVEAKTDWMTDYSVDFCKIIPFYKHEGAVRSVSKICLFLARFHLEQRKIRKPFLSQKQLQQITETCFDWLISDTKVASKVYAIYTLFEIGKLNDWIYPELKEILQKDFSVHSPAYQSASRNILKRINS